MDIHIHGKPGYYLPFSSSHLWVKQYCESQDLWQVLGSVSLIKNVYCHKLEIIHDIWSYVFVFDFTACVDK